MLTVRDSYASTAARSVGKRIRAHPFERAAPLEHASHLWQHAPITSLVPLAARSSAKAAIVSAPGAVEMNDRRAGAFTHSDAVSPVS